MAGPVILALDEWHKSEIDRKELRELVRRLAWFSIGGAWAVPAFALYGSIYAFGEAAAHELGHGTPFKSRWLNETAYWIAGFMSWREHVFSRWLHARLACPRLVVQRLRAPLRIGELPEDIV